MTTLSRQENTGYRYLIIGGAPKSATTSLFRYLSTHPEVCSAQQKETYFFAREFDRKNIRRLESFEEYFTHCTESSTLRVEATPYTLYSHNAAREIRASLPGSKVLFMLRDPVDRLISDYYMQVQRNISTVQTKTFEEYVAMHREDQSSNITALKIGCYMPYLTPFFDAFESDCIRIMFFEEFTANPESQIKKLCEFLEIDGDFYSAYSFQVHNQSANARRKWLNKMYLAVEPVVAGVRARIMHNSPAHEMFERTVNAGKNFANALNKSEPGLASKNSISADIRKDLSEYYFPHNQALSERLGRSLPWKSYS